MCLELLHTMLAELDHLLLRLLCRLATTPTLFRMRGSITAAWFQTGCIKTSLKLKRFEEGRQRNCLRRHGYAVIKYHSCLLEMSFSLIPNSYFLPFPLSLVER